MTREGVSVESLGGAIRGFNAKYIRGWKTPSKFIISSKSIMVSSVICKSHNNSNNAMHSMQSRKSQCLAVCMYSEGKIINTHSRYLPHTPQSAGYLYHISPATERNHPPRHRPAACGFHPPQECSRARAHNAVRRTVHAAG